MPEIVQLYESGHNGNMFIDNSRCTKGFHKITILEGIAEPGECYLRLEDIEDVIKGLRKYVKLAKKEDDK